MPRLRPDESMGTFAVVQASTAQLVAGARMALKAGQLLTALVLTYTAIDVFGWLGAEHERRPVKLRFCAWAGRYLLPSATMLTCTPEELYAARCGMLHTLTGVSEGTAKREGRVLGYTFGDQPAEPIQAASDRRGGRTRMVRIEDLIGGLQVGASTFFSQAAKDPTLRGRIEHRGQELYLAYPGERFAHLIDADRRE